MKINQQLYIDLLEREVLTLRTQLKEKNAELEKMLGVTPGMKALFPEQEEFTPPKNLTSEPIEGATVEG